MQQEFGLIHATPVFQIQRAALGYRVVGPGLLIWEATLGEAVEQREELEGGRRQFPPGEPPDRSAEEPGGIVYITISGRGEPTLHPHFSAVVERICDAAEGSGVPVRILTNGGRIPDPCVRSSLDRLDERIVNVGDVPPVSAAELEEIACRLRARTGIDAGVFA